MILKLFFHTKFNKNHSGSFSLPPFRHSRENKKYPKSNFDFSTFLLLISSENTTVFMFPSKTELFAEAVFQISSQTMRCSFSTLFNSTLTNIIISPKNIIFILFEQITIRRYTILMTFYLFNLIAKKTYPLNPQIIFVSLTSVLSLSKVQNQ